MERTNKFNTVQKMINNAKRNLRFIEIQKEMKLEVIFMLEMLLKLFTTPLLKNLKMVTIIYLEKKKLQ